MHIKVTGGFASGKTTFLRNLQKDYPCQIITVFTTTAAALKRMLEKDKVIMIDDATEDEADKVFEMAKAVGHKGLLVVASSGRSCNGPLKVTVSGFGSKTFDVSKYIP